MPLSVEIEFPDYTVQYNLPLDEEISLSLWYNCLFMYLKVRALF